MDCAEIKRLLNIWRTCSPERKHLVLSTDCLYPSFDQVKIRIRSAKDGLTVIDDMGGATFSVLSHGKKGTAIEASLNKAAKFYGLKVIRHKLKTEVDSPQWIASAALAVANASSRAAHDAIFGEVETEKSLLLEEIDRNLIEISGEMLEIKKEFTVRRDFVTNGSSGKSWRFDFAVMSKRPILIKTVSPHGNSVNANFVAFSDMKISDGYINYSVFSRSPDESDIRLLNQVANVVPIKSLHARIKREVQLLH